MRRQVLLCRKCGFKNWTADAELALDKCECDQPEFYDPKVAACPIQQGRPPHDKELTMSKVGLLDQPDVLRAILDGRYAAHTRAGRLIGTYDTEGEAMRAVIDDHASRAAIAHPIPAAERAAAIQSVLIGIEKRQAEGLRPVSPATLALARELRAAGKG